jgi:hypothetical protein
LGGSWGKENHLHRLLQRYAVEKTCPSQCTPCYGSG